MNTIVWKPKAPETTQMWAFMQYGPDKIPFVFQDPFSKYINILVKIFVTFITMGIFVTWSMYYLNTDIITSIRIVDISQDGLFQHTVSELRLMNIEDVTGETKGILGNIFAFGNVYVQTAGKEERFTFQNVPHPDKVEQLIQDLCEVAEKQPVPIKASQPE